MAGTTEWMIQHSCNNEAGMNQPALAIAQSSFDFVMRLLAVLSFAIGCITAHAGDDRFGFDTHFEQGWPSSPVMQAIAWSGVSYIRDDLNAGSWETSPGVYVQPSWDIGWLNAAKANGLKVVGILGPNWHYKRSRALRCGLQQSNDA